MRFLDCQLWVFDRLNTSLIGFKSAVYFHGTGRCAKSYSFPPLQRKKREKNQKPSLTSSKRKRKPYLPICGL